MSPSRRRLRFCASSAYSSSSVVMISARTSRFPSRSRVLRPADSARTTLPSAIAMWMSSSRDSRCSTPLFACCPMSWRISAIPKSLRVPLSATAVLPYCVRRKASRTASAQSASPSGAATTSLPTSTYGEGCGGGRIPRQNQTTNPAKRIARRSGARRAPARRGRPAPAPPPTTERIRVASAHELLVAPDLRLLAEPVARVHEPLLHEDVHALAAQLARRRRRSGGRRRRRSARTAARGGAAAPASPSTHRTATQREGRPRPGAARAGSRRAAAGPRPAIACGAPSRRRRARGSSRPAPGRPRGSGWPRSRRRSRSARRNSPASRSAFSRAAALWVMSAVRR